MLLIKCTAVLFYRDIKPENVLFASNMVLKVADFGLAVSVREERAVTRVGASPRLVSASCSELQSLSGPFSGYCCNDVHAW